MRKEDIQEETLASGIIVPVTKKPTDVADYPVEYISEKCTQVSTADRVVFPIRMGTQFEVDGCDFVAINERNIMCKIED